MRKAFCHILAVVSLASAAVAGTAAEAPPEAQTCTSCHGPQGQSGNPAWPNLAGQHATYLVNQLQAFRSGARENPAMKPFVANLDDKQIQALASYFAGLPRATSATGDAALVERGRNLAGYCAACHGMRGEPAADEWPVLAGQQAPYLIQQLQAYKSGQRQQSLMQAALANLDEEDFRALAAYYSQLDAGS